MEPPAFLRNIFKVDCKRRLNNHHMLTTLAKPNDIKLLIIGY